MIGYLLLGKTPLFIACLEGRTEMAQKLLAFANIAPDLGVN